MCRRWHAIVDEAIGKEVVISTENSDTSDGDSEFATPSPFGIYGFDVISKMGVKTCYVEMTKWKEDEGTKMLIPKPQIKFKYPFLLRNLFFNGGMKSDLFKGLLSDVNNLTTLELNMFALFQLRPSDLQYLKLPKLRSLGVRKCVKSSCKNFNDKRGLTNLQMLLRYNKFPVLAYLDLRFPISDYKDFGTTLAMLKFLKLHCSLKELCILMEFPVEVHTLPNYEDELEEILRVVRKHRNHSSLKTVEVQGIRLHGSYPQSRVWKEFAQRQQILKSLTLRLGSIHAHTLQSICHNNVSSLENVFLYKLNENGENEQSVILDCSAFENLKRLQTLYALGANEVVNICKLPSTLCTLFITGSMKSQEAEYILLNLPNLHFISLRNVYDQRQDCGVSLELLGKFIEARTVKRLILNGSSLCDEFPPAGILNGDPVGEMYLSVIDNWDPDNTFLDWELNCDNYYINKFY